MVENRLPEEACRARLFTTLERVTSINKEQLCLSEVRIQYPIPLKGKTTKYPDIVLFTNTKKPFMVIEVKKPTIGGGITKSPKTLNQILTYVRELRPDYCIVTDCKSLLLFKVSSGEISPLRSYYKSDKTIITEDFWTNVLRRLCKNDIPNLPPNDKLTPNAERNLLGMAQHMAWKQLAKEHRSLKIDRHGLQKRAKDIYEKWLKELIGY